MEWRVKRPDVWINYISVWHVMKGNERAWMRYWDWAWMPHTAADSWRPHVAVAYGRMGEWGSRPSPRSPLPRHHPLTLIHELHVRQLMRPLSHEYNRWWVIEISIVTFITRVMMKMFTEVRDEHTSDAVTCCRRTSWRGGEAAAAAPVPDMHACVWGTRVPAAPPFPLKSHFFMANITSPYQVAG
jgi:hypothetical protein